MISVGLGLSTDPRVAASHNDRNPVAKSGGCRHAHGSELYPGLLVGTPIAGAVLRHVLAALHAFCGVCVSLVALSVLGARMAKVDLSPTAKVYPESMGLRD